MERAKHSEDGDDHGSVLACCGWHMIKDGNYWRATTIATRHQGKDANGGVVNMALMEQRTSIYCVPRERKT